MKTGDIIYFVAIAAGIAYNFYAKSQKKKQSEWEDILPKEESPKTNQPQPKLNFEQRQEVRKEKAKILKNTPLIKEGESIFDIARKEDAATASKNKPLNKVKNRKTSNFLRKAVVYDTILNRPNY